MTIKRWGYTQLNGPWLRIPALLDACFPRAISNVQTSLKLTGPALPQVTATSSNGGRSHGKHDLVLSPPPVTYNAPTHECPPNHTSDNAVRSMDETSLIQAV